MSANSLGRFSSPQIIFVDWMNKNPILSKEEISNFQSFFKLFQNDEGLAPIPRMIDSLENLADLNTGVVRKVLLSIKQSNGSQSNIISYKF